MLKINNLKQRLTKLIAQTDLAVNDEQVEQLICYVDMLVKWNKAYNLTAIRDPNDILIKHIMDSLAVSPYLIGKAFIDVGTGAGLPGIPLAIINPDKQFDLVDSLGKRIRFLKQVQFELKLSNIDPQQSRIEDYTAKKFDGVISRAFASISDMLMWCHHLPSPTGYFYALKGVDSESTPDGFVIQQTIKLVIPNLNAERCLVIIKSLN